MNDTYATFGGLSFEREDLPILQALARGKVYPVSTSNLFSTRYISRDVSTLRRLYHSGFAILDSHADQVSQRLRASPMLLQLQAEVDAKVKPFETFAAEHGVDISTAACKRQLRKLDSTRKPIYRLFPKVSDVRRKLIDCNDSTENLPSEEGDRYEFSSRTLTDWYVGQYLSLNHLRSLE